MPIRPKIRVSGPFRACADLVVGGQVRHAPETALTVDRLLRRWVAQQEDRGDLRPRGEDLEAAIRAAGLGTLPGGEVIELATRRR